MLDIRVVRIGSLQQRIRAEYREMPGLSLTLGQAIRFWNLDRPTCEDLLTRLVDEGFLHARGGIYRRA